MAPALSTTNQTVWLDTDPGVDDWLAWLLLATQPGVRIAGVSVVGGNAPLNVVLANALRIRAFHGWTVPVHAGASTPLGGGIASTAQTVLGAGALATTGAHLPETNDRADSTDAVDALLRHLRSPAGANTTIVALGPLTNLAHAWQRDPEALRRASGIAWMGGSTDRGNHTPAAEFNAVADPEAVDVVVRCGLPLRVFGLNLCRQLRLTQAHVQIVRAVGTARATLFAGYLDAYQRIASADGHQPMALYDPAVALWCRAPDLFGFTTAPVDVELKGTHTRGMTVCDLRNRAGRAAHVQVATAVDAAPAMRLFTQCLVDALQDPAAMSATHTKALDVAVIGSLNQDVVQRVPNIARAGETVTATEQSLVLGGKGANQAVAAARFGARVCLVGRVGEDAAGAQFRKLLIAEGIDLETLTSDSTVPTGQAVVQVTSSGSNAIVVVPGANGAVSRSDIDAAWPRLKRAGWLLCQGEVPLPVIDHLLVRAAAEGLRVMLNPSPLPSNLDGQPWHGWTRAAALVVNEHEAAQLMGVPVDGPQQGMAVAKALADRLLLPDAWAVVTLGEQGVCLANAHTAVASHLRAQVVQAVDTTGAGDTFTGVLASALAKGQSQNDALALAQAAAALCVQRPGALPSIPRRSEYTANR